PVSISWDPFVNSAGDATEQPELRLFQAHYHRVSNGGYRWGPRSELLPWPADYPDALVPATTGCLGDRQTLFNTVTPAASPHNNALAWVDLYSPASLPVGTYLTHVHLTRGGRALASIPIELQVWPTRMPAQPVISAVGELYRTYRLEGAGEDPKDRAWQTMSQCYQQLAHQHRVVFLERSPDRPHTETDWQHYADTWGPALDGSLFTEDYGYSGTGYATPVGVWRTPWPQPYDVKLQGPLESDEVEQYRAFAAQWQDQAVTRGWTDPFTFAYVFDEVDGPNDEDTGVKRADAYIAMTHAQMDRVQTAIDQGAPQLDIPLIWTSHSNPATWQDRDALDLRGITRLWAPNAHAADPRFLQAREAAGETTWFYHSGHPAVGAHSINASGIDMRTWGVIGARYGITGQLMWAVNLGSDARPFAEPMYKPDDDRFGNGVMVYPGNQLRKIGYPAVAGPIPSIRLKLWRRGLQDADLIALARDIAPAETDALVRNMMPHALADAVSMGRKKQWSARTGDWIAFKKALLALIGDNAH
ncbi:MAG: glycoside hydrolase domain-containing protein, partial [Pseudomonadota bacterium]